MGNLERAIGLWRDIRLSKVIDMDESSEQGFKKLMNGEIELEDIHQLIPQAIEIIKNRGLDVAPLRAWVREIVDADVIHASPVELFISTVSLSDRKGLELRLNDLEENEICDMLLASAYHPSFRMEKLGGKLYADGGFVDALPLHVLVQNGYKDIIAVRLPGMGWEKRFKMPSDVHVTDIHTNSDLGFILNFDAELSRRNMEIGYYDAKRVIYGLYGRDYCIERSLSEREALDVLASIYQKNGMSLKFLCEDVLSGLARELSAEGDDYYSLLVAVIESEARGRNIEKFRIYSDKELIELLF
jgi:NTE family protein